MRHRGWIDVDGGRLYSEADGDGPAVKLIHGGAFLDLANAELHVIEHVGHTPNLEDPDQFNRTALAFVDRVHA